jgi:hypothetical protein
VAGGGAVLVEVSRLTGEHDVDTPSYFTGDGRRMPFMSIRRQRILDAADVRALPKGQAILLATGARAALILQRPWSDPGAKSSLGRSPQQRQS